MKPYWTKRLVGKKFNVVHFVNGYGKHRPWVDVEWKGLRVFRGKYEIYLGNIIDCGNLGDVRVHWPPITGAVGCGG